MGHAFGLLRRILLCSQRHYNLISLSSPNMQNSAYFLKQGFWMERISILTLVCSNNECSWAKCVSQERSHSHSLLSLYEVWWVKSSLFYRISHNVNFNGYFAMQISASNSCINMLLTGDIFCQQNFIHVDMSFKDHVFLRQTV